MRGTMMGVVVAIVVVSLGACGRELSQADEDAGAVVSTALDSRGGTVTLGRVTLEIPEGALDGPATITVRQVARAPRAAVGPAYEFGPDGLTFRRPARLTVSYDGIEMPPGTDPGSLRLSVLDRDRWVALAEQQNDPDALRVSANVEHFSIYGLVPEPRIATGVGTRLEANGVTVEATASVYGRLVVSAYSLSLYVERDATDVVSVTFTGLPTDAENYAYVRSYAEEQVLTPADGGTMTFSLDLREPALIWFQSGPGTTFIGGAGDECVPPVGVRAGDACRLTSDVTGSVELVTGTLDCDGHAIRQAFADRGMGTGAFVGPNAATPVIRNCTIGGTDAQFGNGVVAFRTDGLVATDNRSEDNTVGIVLQSATSSNVARNTVTGPSYWAIALWDVAAGNEVAQNSIAVGYDGITLDGLVNDPTANTANRVVGNTIVGGTGGVLLAHAQWNELTGNNREGGVNGITATADAWPNRVYWNDFWGWSHWGIWMDAGPAAELSDGGRGNWWGKSCPGPLFLPGVDSNRADVVDSFAYGARDAWLTGGVPGCPGDRDGDTVPDGVDNCPDTPNPGQENEDGVGEGDACDVTAPAAPVILEPTAGAVTDSPTPTVGGSAEQRSWVEVFDGSVSLGRTRADLVGTFRLVPTEPLADGEHEVTATAVDAAGNVSAPSAPMRFRVDLLPPASPAIFRPVEGEVLTDPAPLVEGEAEAGSRVVLLYSGAPVAETIASESARFAVRFPFALANGTHTVSATARDALGRTSSPSPAVTFQVRVVRSDAPLVGTAGRARVTTLVDSPDPFDPAVESSALRVGVEVDAVAGIGGASPNHRFYADLTWTLRHPETSTVTRTILGRAELPHGPGIRVARADLVASWDGVDSAGQRADFEVAYPYDVNVDVIRVFVGAGEGPPCSRDGSSVVTSRGEPACLIDTIAAPAVGTVRLADTRFVTAFRDLQAVHRQHVEAWLATLPLAEADARRAAALEDGDELGNLSILWSQAGTLGWLGGEAFAVRPADLGLGPGASPRDMVAAFLRRWGALLGVGDAAAELLLTKEATTATGAVHLRYAQRYFGVEVDGGIVTFHFAPDGSIQSIDSSFITPLNLSITPVLGAADALAAAVRTLPEPPVVKRARLVIRDPAAYGGTRAPRLSWRVDAMGVDGTEWLIHIDALTGAVLEKRDISARAAARSLWNIRDPTDRTRNLTEATNYCTSAGCLDPTGWIPDPDPARPDGSLCPNVLFYGEPTGCLAHAAYSDATWNLPAARTDCDRTTGTDTSGAANVWDATRHMYAYWLHRYGRRSWDGADGIMWSIVTGWSPITGGWNQGVYLDDSCLRAPRGWVWASNAGILPHEWTHVLQQREVGKGWYSAWFQDAAIMQGDADIYADLVNSASTTDPPGPSSMICRVAPAWTRCEETRNVPHLERYWTIADPFGVPDARAGVNGGVNWFIGWLLSQTERDHDAATPGNQYNYHGQTVTSLGAGEYEQILYDAIVNYFRPDEDFRRYRMHLIAAARGRSWTSQKETGDAADAVGLWSTSYDAGSVIVRGRDRPAVALWSDRRGGNVYLFYRTPSSSSRIYYKVFSLRTTRWGPAAPLNDPATYPAGSEPVATVRRVGDINLVYVAWRRSTDDRVVYMWVDATGVLGGPAVGPATALTDAAPALASLPSVGASDDLFLAWKQRRSSAVGIVRLDPAGGVAHWPTGFVTAAAPTMVGYSGAYSRRLYLFFPAAGGTADRVVYGSSADGTTWAGPNDLSSAVDVLANVTDGTMRSADPVAAAVAGATAPRIHLLVRSTTYQWPTTHPDYPDLGAGGGYVFFLPLRETAAGSLGPGGTRTAPDTRPVPISVVPVDGGTPASPGAAMAGFGRTLLYHYLGQRYLSYSCRWGD